MNGFDPVAFLEAAVRTPSHDRVGPVRDMLVARLAERGVDAAVDDAGNVVAVRDSGTPGPHVALNTHLDTVPPHVPLRREDGVVHGRGACDAKGPLAALLAAFLEADPERGRVTLAVTPDEETDSTGAAALDLDADAVIVGEPTGLDVCNAAKGRFQATVTVEGTSAHAAQPAEGTNAIRVAGRLLDALDSFDDGTDPHPALGRPTLVPTTIEGGTATNQVPESCSFVVDRRPPPAERAEDFRAALEAHLREATPAGVSVSVALAERETPFLSSFETPADARLVRVLREASGGDVRPFGAATEASYFAGEAPTVVFGPGDLADGDGPVAHSPREYVEIEDVRAAAGAVEETLDVLLR